MNFSGVVAAVFFGNMLTVCFLWGFMRVSRIKAESEIGLWVYVALLLPLIAFFASLIGAGVQPPFLAAIGAP